MAEHMIQCRDCLSDIPLGAIRCQHCGVAQERWWETGRTRSVAAVLAGVAALVLIRLDFWHALGL